jgi:uncharacterized repeat protein (TIGR01451 family)
VGMSSSGPGRRTCPVGLVGALVAALACVMAFAGTAEALRVKARNWPNSPVRHALKQRVGAATPSFSANLRGGVATAGDTLETCPANVSATRKPHHKRPKGRRGANEPCIDDNNNGLNMQYVDVDPSGHFDSSSARLTVPAGARVVKAFLYWAADLSRGIENGQGQRTGAAAPGGDTPQGQTPHIGDKPHTTNTAYGTVDLSVDSGASYTTVNAFTQGSAARWDSVSSWYSTSPQTNPPEGGSPGWAYQVRADVTSELNDALATRARPRAGNESLPITVANVQAGTGLNRHAGWNLVVVWRLPTAPFRDITLFDGFDFVQVQGGQQLVVGPLDFTGFETPHSGNVDAHVTVWATEGDRAITGDYMSLGDLTSNCGALKRQSDASHPIDNFFNSSISNAGKPVSDRTPAYDNQLGFDLATLALPEGTIKNGATGASVCLGTSGDTYFFGGLVFDTLIRAPNLGIEKVADHANADPGDVVTYTTTVTNPQRSPDDPLGPTATAINVTTADPLPSGLDFAGFTNDHGGACVYNDITRAIRCTAGSLAPDGSFSYSYRATVSAVAQGDSSAPLINTACFTANSEDQPDTVFTGCDQASVVVPPAPPSPPISGSSRPSTTTSSHPERRSPGAWSQPITAPPPRQTSCLPTSCRPTSRSSAPPQAAR